MSEASEEVVSLNSSKRRFSLGLLFSLNIHIILFLCFSPYSAKPSFSSPKIVYYQTEDSKQKVTKSPSHQVTSQQQKKIVELRTEQRNLHTGRINHQVISHRQKKNIKPKAKNRISIKDRIFAKKASAEKQRKKEKIAIEQKQQEKVLQEKNLISYYQIISEQIKQKAVYPEEARRDLSQGLVYISFTVLSSGHLKKINIKISSGNDYLDKAALQSVQDAGSFPPFPPQIKEKQLCLNIPISFEME